MEPTQKKCLMLSAAMHGVLLVLLLLGAAFTKPVQPRQIIPIKYFSGELMDSILNGGGGAPRMVTVPNPNPTPAPPSPNPPAPVPPTPNPPTPKATVTPPPPTPERTVTPPRTENNSAKINPKAVTTTPKESKKPTISTELTTRKSGEKSTSAKSDSTSKADRTAKAAAAAAASKARLEAFNRTFSDLSKGVAAGGGLTVSDVLGKGVGGGPGGVNYSQAVLGAYDDAWNPPPELNEDRAVALVRIVVHRTGRIVDARITKRSGIHLMDLSVQNALEAVKELPPFPQGARDLERTFTIEFNLKVKRGLG